MKMPIGILLCWAAMVLVFVGMPGCSGDKEVAELISNLDEDDPEDRHDAVKGLENLGLRAAPAARELGKCLHDEDEQVRYRAAKTLAKLGRAAKPAIKPLAKALVKERNPKVRYYLAKAIVEIADQEPEAIVPVIPELIEALAVTDAKSLYYVIKALGKVGPDASAAVEQLERLVNDQDESVRRAAQAAVERIKQQQSTT